MRLQDGMNFGLFKCHEEVSLGPGPFSATSLCVSRSQPLWASRVPLGRHQVGRVGLKVGRPESSVM